MITKIQDIRYFGDAYYFKSLKPIRFCFYFDLRDQTERTPLHFAAHKGALGCCKLMVDKFEDHINDVDKSKVELITRIFSVYESFCTYNTIPGAINGPSRGALCE